MLDPSKMKLTLFTGPDCHLCDDAVVILNQVNLPDLLIVKKNIREDAQLYHFYAVKIPVLKREDTNDELEWPFDLDAVETFLR